MLISSVFEITDANINKYFHEELCALALTKIVINEFVMLLLLLY